MSLLVRAALLGGLAYVVSRAVRKSDAATFLNRADADRIDRADTGRISRDTDDGRDLGWQSSDQSSTTHV